MVNPEHEIIVKQGAKAIEKWRQEHSDEILDLSHAYLSDIELEKVDLSKADLREAWLSKSVFYEVKLSEANLSGAVIYRSLIVSSYLNEAELSNAKLFNCLILATDFSNANLRGTDLSFNSFFSCVFFKTIFDESLFNYTQVGRCDFSTAIGLENTKHESPSSIGIDALVSSYRGAGNRFTNELRKFFINTGIQRELMESLPRVISEIKYFSAFIGYGQPDIDFAERLVNDLKARGVSCWLYQLDYTPGESTWREIIQKRREFDKMIAVCSVSSLIRNGFLKELEEQLDEEPEKIIPISLDDVWKNEGFKVIRGERNLKPFLMEKNYADFEDWQINSEKYEESLKKLLKALEISE